MTGKRNWCRQAWYVGVGLLMALQLVVILGSWLWSAAMPESSVRSLLNEAGIRWFFGSFIGNLSNPLLMWIILLDIAAGACGRSGLWAAVKGIPSMRSLHDRRQRAGLRAAAVIIVAEALVIASLTLTRHATLLNLTGSLFPSSFSVSIVPIVAAMATTSAIGYGLYNGGLHGYKDAVGCLLGDGKRLKAILVAYVFAIELYYMAKYAAGF